LEADEVFFIQNVELTSHWRLKGDIFLSCSKWRGREGERERERKKAIFSQLDKETKRNERLVKDLVNVVQKDFVNTVNSEFF